LDSVALAVLRTGAGILVLFGAMFAVGGAVLLDGRTLGPALAVAATGGIGLAALRRARDAEGTAGDAK